MVAVFTHQITVDRVLGALGRNLPMRIFARAISRLAKILPSIPQANSVVFCVFIVGSIVSRYASNDWFHPPGGFAA